MFTEFSKKVECNFKWYFFDVKKAKTGDVYIKITLDELKSGKKERNTVIIFQDHFDEVYPVLVEALKFAKENRNPKLK
jgi:hypothetical protein